MIGGIQAATPRGAMPTSRVMGCVESASLFGEDRGSVGLATVAAGSSALACAGARTASTATRGHETSVRPSRARVGLGILAASLAGLAAACSDPTPSSEADASSSATGSTSTGGLAEAEAGTGASGTGAETGSSSLDESSGGSEGTDTGDIEDPGRPSGVFGGGPFYHDAETVIPRLRASGFRDMILWSVHVPTSGDLVLNDVLIVSDGEYVGDPGWPAQVSSLKEPPTSVTRIEFSVGAWGTTDFEHIQQLIEEQGTGPRSVLYRNFAALREVIPEIDAINYDDESNYHLESTVAFSLMLEAQGYRVSFAPYTNQGFWVALYDQLAELRPGLVDRVRLQVYAGGSGNDPAAWSRLFAGLEVDAGLWSRHGAGCMSGDSPQQVYEQMLAWSDAINGGWMWLLDDMLACDEQFELELYAEGIDQALNPR